MAQLEQGKKYTPDELNAILGPTWITTLSASNPPSIQKDIVYSFDDLNNNAKEVYKSIYNLVKQLNPNSIFAVFAVGDYVSGRWKSVDEANQQSQQYQITVPPSTYSFWTNAATIPHEIETSQIQSDAPIKFDASNDTHKVIIPPQN